MQICASLFLLGLLFLCSCAKETDGTFKEEGSISGFITQATDGAAISGATLYVLGDQSFTEDSSVADGSYTMTNVLEGSISIQVEASGYASQTLPLSYGSDLALTGYNISMFTPAYASGNYIIILSWGADPQDLDAHFFVPAGPDYTVSCAPAAACEGDGVGDATIITGGAFTVRPFSYLDNDDQNGNGPETILYDKGVGDAPHYAGNHRYWVKNFGANPTAEFKTSNAIVRVYNESSLIKTYNVPTTGTTERYWTVFDMDASGNITDINNLGTVLPADP